MKMRRESEGTERGALLQPPPHWLPAVTVTGSKRIEKGLQVPPSPGPLGGHSRGRSLAQAGDVGTSAGRCHDALSRAARDVVVDLCPCGRETKRQAPPPGPAGEEGHGSGESAAAPNPSSPLRPGSKILGGKSLTALHCLNSAETRSASVSPHPTPEPPSPAHTRVG